MIAVLDEVERRAFITGDVHTLKLLDLAEQAAEEREGEVAESLADIERQLSETQGHIEALADTLRAARPLKKAQMLALADLLASLTDSPPEGQRAGAADGAGVRGEPQQAGEGSAKLAASAKPSSTVSTARGAPVKAWAAAMAQQFVASINAKAMQNDLPKGD